eukprot:873019-Rhodomonas_salina.2
MGDEGWRGVTRGECVGCRVSGSGGSRVCASGFRMRGVGEEGTATSACRQRLGGESDVERDVDSD